MRKGLLSKKEIMARSEARRLRVVEMRKSGMSMPAIGRIEGVTPERIRQLLGRTKQLEARGEVTRCQSKLPATG